MVVAPGPQKDPSSHAFARRRDVCFRRGVILGPTGMWTRARCRWTTRRGGQEVSCRGFRQWRQVRSRPRGRSRFAPGHARHSDGFGRCTGRRGWARRSGSGGSASRSSTCRARQPRRGRAPSSGLNAESHRQEDELSTRRRPRRRSGTVQVQGDLVGVEHGIDDLQATVYQTGHSLRSGPDGTSLML